MTIERQRHRGRSEYPAIILTLFYLTGLACPVAYALIQWGWSR